MGHPVRNRKKSSKPRVRPLGITVGAMTDDGKVNGVPAIPSPEVSNSHPQENLPLGASTTPVRPLAGLSNEELDMLFCLAVRHHFEQEKVWVPSVLRTMPLLEGINDKTGRPCRIYIRPNRRVVIVETLL